MFDAHEYLRKEFRRYFPDADRIDVHSIDELWQIDVRTMGNSHVRTFEMEVGSDDDCFVFTNNVSGQVITVPFAPEMGQ